VRRKGTTGFCSFRAQLAQGSHAPAQGIRRLGTSISVRAPALGINPHRFGASLKGNDNRGALIRIAADPTEQGDAMTLAVVMSRALDGLAAPPVQVASVPP
jgi:hypothetical protein